MENLIVVYLTQNIEGEYLVVDNNNPNAKMVLAEIGEGEVSEYTRASLAIEKKILTDWKGERKLSYQVPMFSWYLAKVHIH